jgi:hypothetical protein
LDDAADAAASAPKGRHETSAESATASRIRLRDHYQRVYSGGSASARHTPIVAVGLAAVGEGDADIVLLDGLVDAR